MEYPKALYRKGDGFEWEGRQLDGMTVEDADAEKSARADGWRPVGEVLEPLDHDGDGRKGGSRPRPRKAAQ